MHPSIPRRPPLSSVPPPRPQHRSRRPIYCRRVLLLLLRSSPSTAADAPASESTLDPPTPTPLPTRNHRPRRRVSSPALPPYSLAHPPGGLSFGHPSSPAALWTSRGEGGSGGRARIALGGRRVPAPWHGISLIQPGDLSFGRPSSLAALWMSRGKWRPSKDWDDESLLLDLASASSSPASITVPLSSQIHCSRSHPPSRLCAFAHRRRLPALHL